MEFITALEIVKALAKGINPVDGKEFAPESVYNHPDVIRALYALLEQAPKVRRTPAQKQQANASRGLPRNVGLPWTEVARRGLADAFRNGAAIDDLAREHERTKGAIVAELLRQQIISPEQANQFLGFSKPVREWSERRTM